MSEVPELRRYARRATAGIASGHERAEAAAELYEHLLASYEDARTNGLEHTSAIAEALRVFGEVGPLATELGRAHRQPLSPRALLLLVTVPVLFFLVMWAWVVALFTYGDHTVWVFFGGLTLAAIAAIATIVYARRSK